MSGFGTVQLDVRRYWGVCRGLLAVIVMVVVLSAGWEGMAAGSVKLKTFSGCCDASAGVALDANSFVVGDDEGSILRIYDVKDPSAKPREVDVSAALNLRGKRPESDIEAAAMVGDRIYWITSHGLNREGKERENRHRFFATQVDRSSSPVSITSVGRAYEFLQADILRAPTLASLNLARSVSISPKAEGGFNIEGLGAGPGGKLWIGLRGPMLEGKAIMIPLLNPEQVIDNGTAAVFGEPRLLNLGGLAVRDMVWRDGAMYILAGPTLLGQPYRVFRWDGQGVKVESVGEAIDVKGHPEVLMAFPDAAAHKFYILLDDGSREIGGVRCKDLPAESRYFRGGVWRSGE